MFYKYNQKYNMNVWWFFICFVEIAGARDSKENEFVEIVKMNLQRNNEDYVDTTTNSSLPNKGTGGRRSLQYINLDYDDFTITTTGEFKTESKLEKPANKNTSKNIAAFNNILIDVPNLKPRHQKHKGSTMFGMENEKIIKQGKNKYKTKKVNTHTPMKITETRTRNLARYAEYNKPKKPIFINMKQILRNANKDAKDKDGRKKSILENITYESMEREWIEFKKKQEEENKAMKIIETGVYDNRQFDMAPARGSGIQSKRMQNRLCMRNVLMPEGPKYDSQGRGYRPALVQRRGQGFGSTTPHNMILPRCCNCCKKSVLGCE